MSSPIVPIGPRREEEFKLVISQSVLVEHGISGFFRASMNIGSNWLVPSYQKAARGLPVNQTD